LKKVKLQNLPASGGATTALDNLTTTNINQHLLPSTAGIRDLGSSSKHWQNFYIESIQFETGGTISASENQIIANSGGLVLNVPAGDRYEFLTSGSIDSGGVIIGENEIAFGQNGREHQILAQSSALQLIAENTSDEIELFTGASRTNLTMLVSTLVTEWQTETNQTGAYRLRLLQNHDTPATNRAIGSLEGYAENDSSSNILYGRLEFSTADSVAAADEAGRVQIEIRTNGSFVNMMEFEGSSSSSAGKIGVFGTSAVEQQSVASDTLANLYTALRNYGWIA
jgi:hypothetical protein